MPQPSAAPILFLRFLLALCGVMLIACASKPPPAFLADTDVIPVGSRIEFWVDHDKHGWVESNIHIAFLPRLMNGAEARRWAEGVGDRDAGLKWTRYYLLVTHPGPDGNTYRSAVFNRGSRSHQMSARLGP